GIEAREADREADLIISDITGLSLAQQILQEERLLTSEEANHLKVITDRRKQRMPLQYCLGYTHFMRTKLTVAPGVFIPRPDTEVVVVLAAQLLQSKDAPFVSEIGTGSGAISIALLQELPKANITGIDLSPEAIELTRLNAMQNGVIDRLAIVLGNWREVLPMALDAIVSNPPYIPRHKKDSLSPEVANFEPELALFGDDPDGLGFYRSFAKIAPQHLKNDGLVVLEFGDEQDAQVSLIFSESDWRNVQIHKDLNGLPRVVTATCPIKSA
ncbi:MAG: peptide chain release factor N(5)-glutamine methyltransferase, partial [Candidatus Obscuribacterales bacterium]|nr:peptide chain release factor N(5)-glutamine methyltransferase [Candidatus Obscuribacterales bacterium]